MKNRKVVGSFISLALVFVYAILMITSHRFTVFSLLWIIAIPVAIVSTVRLVRYFKNKRKTKTKEQEEVEEINEEQKTHDEEEERRPKMKFNWRNFLSMAFAVLFAVIAIVMIIVKFAWLSLIPVACMAISLICYFAFKRNDAITADEEEDKEAGKAWFWHMIVAIGVLVVSVLLIAIYAMVGDLLKDGTNFKNLVVDTLVVNEDAEIKGDLNVEQDANVNGDLNVEQDVNVNGDVNVEKDVNVNGNVNVEQDVNVKGNVNVEKDVNVKGDLNVSGNVNTTTTTTTPTTSNPTTTTPTTPSTPSTPTTPTTPSAPTTPTTPSTPSEPTTPSTPTTPSEPTTPTEPTVEPKISAPATISYGETVYVNLTGINASDLLVSNKRFVSVEKISDSRVAITLTEDIDGYITITDSVSRVNVVIDVAN